MSLVKQSGNAVAIVLSIKPVYAEAILSGTKMWEFRKRIGKQFAPGVQVLVYACFPVCKVVGEFVISQVECFTCEVASKLSNKGLTAKELTDYAGGSTKQIYCIGVYHPRRYETPLPLIAYGVERAPQSFQYLPLNRLSQ